MGDLLTRYNRHTVQEYAQLRRRPRAQLSRPEMARLVELEAAFPASARHEIERRYL